MDASPTPTRAGRPPGPVSRERRARFLTQAAGHIDVRLAPGFSLERTMDELGLSPRALVRLLDDPAYPAALEAVRAAIDAE